MTAAGAAAAALSARHFLWLGLATWQGFALFRNLPAWSCRQLQVSVGAPQPGDEELRDDDARVARLRSLLGAVGADLSKVSAVRVRVTDRPHVVATGISVEGSAPLPALTVTVSRALVDDLLDDERADLTAQLRAAALTGHMPLTAAQSNAIVAPALLHLSLAQHAAGQLQHTLMIVLPPIFGLALRRRFPGAHDRSILVSNVAYTLCAFTVEQAWFPRTRLRRSIDAFGPAYVDAAIEAAELQRAANRHTRAELLRAAKSDLWRERVPARFQAMLYSRNGNYWGDFGLRTTTMLRLLNNSKAKTAESK